MLQWNTRLLLVLVLALALVAVFGFGGWTDLQLGW
jgi:hypothetical protein